MNLTHTFLIIERIWNSSKILRKSAVMSAHQEEKREEERDQSYLFMYLCIFCIEVLYVVVRKQLQRIITITGYTKEPRISLCCGVDWIEA